MRSLLLGLLIACGGSSKTPPPGMHAPLAITPETAEAAYEAKNWAECAAQWTTVGERVTGEARAGALYDAACCYALDGRVDAAIAALEAALDAGYWDADHLAIDDDLATVRAHATWPALDARAKTALERFERSLGDPALRRELLALAARDQQTRAAIKSPDDTAGIEAALAVDREATARLKEIVANHGWPGKSLVAVDGANAAWLLVQHADAEPAFQKECLDKMEPMVKTGEVSGKDFAYLWDRVAVNAGKPQRYGTQFDGDDLAPMEDPANVDARRQAVGLSTLAEYKALVKKLEAEDRRR